MKINTYIKSTQYTVVSTPFEQRLFQDIRVCTQKPLHKKKVHTTNLPYNLYLSAFVHDVYCVFLHRYPYTKNKC